MKQSDLMEHDNYTTLLKLLEEEAFKANIACQEATDIYHSNLRGYIIKWLLLSVLWFILLLICVAFELPPLSSVLAILELIISAVVLNESSTVEYP